MAEISNHLKAVLVLDDLSGSNDLRVNRSECLTLKKFHYRCSRGRNEYRITGSLTGSSLMSLELKLNSESNVRIFYECLKKSMPQPFSIVFNATYDENADISDYQDAMTVYGYVIAVNDTFNAGVMTGEGRGKVDIKVDILVSTITYLGKEQNLILRISNS